jgi:hypothetical protein
MSKKEQWACSLSNSGSVVPFLLLMIVGSSTVTIVASCVHHNRKSNFLYCYDLRDTSKFGSSLAFSRSSRHTFKRRCFWSCVKSRGTNFAAMRRMFIFFLLRSPGKPHNWSQRCLRTCELFGDGLRGWILEYFRNFLLFCRALSPWTFVIFNWHSTCLETSMSFKNLCPA